MLIAIFSHAADKKRTESGLTREVNSRFRVPSPSS